MGSPDEKNAFDIRSVFLIWRSHSCCGNCVFFVFVGFPNGFATVLDQGFGFSWFMLFSHGFCCVCVSKSAGGEPVGSPLGRTLRLADRRPIPIPLLCKAHIRTHKPTDRQTEERYAQKPKAKHKGKQGRYRDAHTHNRHKEMRTEHSAQTHTYTDTDTETHTYTPRRVAQRDTQTDTHRGTKRSIVRVCVCVVSFVSLFVCGLLMFYICSLRGSSNETNEADTHRKAIKTRGSHTQNKEWKTFNRKQNSATHKKRERNK